jgi:hypothetical protein
MTAEFFKNVDRILIGMLNLILKQNKKIGCSHGIFVYISTFSSNILLYANKKEISECIF